MYTRLERKLQSESEVYNPFGRGGAGAPIKDKDGNVKADLGRLRSDANELQNAPLDIQREIKMQQIQLDRMNNPSPTGFLFDNNGNKRPTKAVANEGDEPNFARGGNGIFGEAKVTNLKYEFKILINYNVALLSD